MGPVPDYDLRYLAGAVLFNRQDYFAAHEIWEDLWHDCPAADRRFYQSLIQAAVALYHWKRGNAAGARRLFQSARDYMAPYGPSHHGLDVPAFWAAMTATTASPARPPVILLDPPPAAWPGEDTIARLLDPSGDET